MNTLTHTNKFHRFTTKTATFRFYDCLDRGYVIMTNGKVIGTVDTLAQAQQFAINYKGV